MTDTHPGAGVLSYLRAPRFTREDKKTPRKAMLHALPATLFLSCNAWLIGLGAVFILGLWLSAPFIVFLIAALIIAVPCIIVTWMVFVRCSEVEAGMES